MVSWFCKSFGASSPLNLAAGILAEGPYSRSLSHLTAFRTQASQAVIITLATHGMNLADMVLKYDKRILVLDAYIQLYGWPELVKVRSLYLGVIGLHHV